MSVLRKGTPNWRIHPGEILREEFLKPMGVSAYALAKRLRVPPPRINDIVLERRGITADTALRLSRFFGTTEQFWLNLQDAYDIGRARVELARELGADRAAEHGGNSNLVSKKRIFLGELRDELLTCSRKPNLLPFPPRPLRHNHCRNSTPRTEIALDFSPHRTRPPHYIIQHPVHNVLLKDSQVSIRLQVLLQRL